MILIVSVSDDLHANVILGKLKERGYKDSHLIASDLIATSQSISINITNQGVDGYLADGGRRISLRDAKVLWLRRPRAVQLLDESAHAAQSLELINNDCRVGLNGLITTSFHGKWISAPAATQQASDKVFQLLAAKFGGFRIPATMVSQNRDEVIEFFERCDHNIIVKTLAGTNNAFLLTRRLANPRDIASEAFAVCPAIYQENIPGTDHLRMNVFGDRSYAALIRSTELDWRPDLRVPVTAWSVPAELHRKARGVLDHLGLEMGAIDLKITPAGEFVWLEVNPQGQFLFLDALTKLNLADRFADYLIDTASCVKRA